MVRINFFIITLFFPIYIVFAQPILVSNNDFTNISEDIKINPIIPKTKVVYYNGNKFCYLYEHMNGGFFGETYCWKGDLKNLSGVLSYDAKKYIDSVTTKHRINLSVINCIKINEENSHEFLRENYLTKRKYAFFNFERTHDCFEKKMYKNFDGKIKIKKDTKLYVSYFKSIPSKYYEKLVFYVIN